MMASITQGRRVPFREGFPRYSLPGDYCKVSEGIDPREEGAWYVVDPGGGGGAILPSTHSIEEHDDSTITCSPSLVMPSGWHGWLERGVWREA